jgi:heat shock protein HslJ
MNFKKTVLFAIIGLLFSCTSQKTKNMNNQRQWMLISFDKFDKDFLIKNQAELNLSSIPGNKNHYSAFMGCNQLMVSGELKSGKVNLEVTGATMQYCEGNMDLEKKFSIALSTMKKYTIEGHFLTLENENGNKMKFVAADWD